MEEIYTNVEHNKSVHSRPSTCQTGLWSSVRRFHALVVLCLVLLSVLLLAGLIGLGVHYHDSAQSLAAELSVIKQNLSECLQNNKILTKQRDPLNRSSTETSQKLECLNRCCPADWTVFSSSCYLLSNDSGSWEEAEKDCRDRGARLVVVNGTEEQTFLSNIGTKKTHAWIGLTDRDQEGSWIWINGAPLSLTYWQKSQPDNGDGKLGEEDCAHIIVGVNSLKNWNDLSCDTSLRWICKKKI